MWPVSTITSWQSWGMLPGCQMNTQVHTRIVEMFHKPPGLQQPEKDIGCICWNGNKCALCSCHSGLRAWSAGARCYILHWGPASDILSYWQEVGRCARDGGGGTAITYLYPRSINKSFINSKNIEMLQKIETGTCIRRSVFRVSAPEGNEPRLQQDLWASRLLLDLQHQTAEPEVDWCIGRPIFIGPISVFFLGLSRLIELIAINFF